MILKMAAVRYLGFLKLKFLTAVHFRDIFYIMEPNFVEIGHMLPLAETSQFFAFLRNIKKFDDRTVSRKGRHQTHGGNSVNSQLILFFFTGRLSNKPFLMVIHNLPHFKYVATLPCNLSLIACFLTLIFHKVVWQHVRCCGIFNNHFIANLLENQPEKEL